MTRLQKLQLEQSETRQKIGEALDTPVDKRAETYQADLDQLTKRAQSIEVELRAAIVAGDGDESEESTDESNEDRELRELEERADIGGIFDAALTGGVTDGAEAELQQHLGLSSNQIPIELLRRGDVDQGGDLEQRTTSVTPAPGDVGQSQAPIIPYVFPMSAGAYLRIPQPTVPVGDRVYTVLGTAASGGTPAKGAEQAHSTAGFTAEVLSPARIQASLFYAREDAARLRGMGEALRRNLNDALADELDQVILTGTNGLLTGTNLANHNASAVTTFDGYVRGMGYSRVDGRFAMQVSDLRLLFGTATYAHAASVYRNNSVDRSALDRLMQVAGGVRVSANMRAVASNKQNALIRRGSRMDAVTPIWQGVSIITDEVTQAKAGEIVLTAIMLYAFKILRTDGFVKVQSQHQ